VKIHGVLKRNTWVPSSTIKISWPLHIGNVVAKIKVAPKVLYPLTCIKSKRQLCLSYIQTIMTYASAAWAYDPTAIAKAFQERQNKFLRVLTKVPWFVQDDAFSRNLLLDPLNIVFQRQPWSFTTGSTGTLIAC
jgi:hypothetical protein